MSDENDEIKIGKFEKLHEEGEGSFDISEEQIQAAIDSFTERHKTSGVSKQQFAMTNMIAIQVICDSLGLHMHIEDYEAPEDKGGLQ